METFPYDYKNYVWSTPNQEARKFWPSCGNLFQCPSWRAFLRGFRNEAGIRSSKYEYGTQNNNGKKYTQNGLKWFYGMVIASKASKTGKKGVGFLSSLNGQWTPSSSGGQASFSEGMHWCVRRRSLGAVPKARSTMCRHRPSLLPSLLQGQIQRKKYKYRG